MSERPLRNVMLTVAYDGTAYFGWQVQPNGPTVQEHVEQAIEKLTGKRSRVYCAGRTDSGVHALGQVANFRTDSTIDAAQMRRGLTRFLPDDISVVRSQDVSDEFHATFSAIRKTYRYLIFDGFVCPPFLRNAVCASRTPLDTEAMRSALPALHGTHDFRCFETQYPNKATSIRTIEAVTLNRTPHWSIWQSDHQWIPTDPRDHEDLSAPLICFEITADGFLYNMVRAIMGTLISIGRGRKHPDHMREVIESMDRGKAGTTAPPQGLYLVRVEYPDDHLIVNE